MTLQEIWEIKKDLSQKFFGKTADEINMLIKKNADEVEQKIREIRLANGLQKI